VEGPAAFQTEKIIDESDMGGLSVQGMNDVCTSKDGRIFLVDTLESRVNVMDQDGNFVKSIKVIRDSDNKIIVDQVTGAQLVLNAPEGAFFYDKANELYIADTGAGRIIVLDGTDYTMRRVIGKPDNMAGVSEYKPSKLVVDQAGRIYIVVQSSYEGIIELNSDGTFSRYFGVNSPKVNLVDYFWKSISTDKQKEKMTKTFAPAFNNVSIDADGFIYAVTYDNASEYMAFRLNSSGVNILREEGNTFVEGDIYYFDMPSQFVDIAVTDYGAYAILDKTKGRIFIYDYDGQLLNAFGSIGKTKNSFQMPSGIAWLGDKLVATDSMQKCAYILEPTDFGRTALAASEKYYYGQWDDALALNQQILRLNANYELAYTGIGKNYFMKDEYKKAMYYFKLGNNHLLYSKAYNGYRGEILKKNFGIVAVIFLVFIFLIVYSEVRYHKKEGRPREE
jgi:DNA-binding beta-propeller fold protein YncE